MLSPDDGAPEDWKTTIHEVRDNAAQAKLTYQTGNEERHFSFTFSPVAQSRQINVYGYDITERVAAENRLRQAQKMEAIGQLTGGIAHDFNNLLAVIVGNLELQIDLPEDEARDGQFLEKALNAADRGSRLTQRLLALAKNQPLNLAPVDLRRHLLDLEDLLRRSLGETVEIVFDVADETWFCLADPSQLENVVLNLAVNARDAMPNGGTLSISTIIRVLDKSEADAINVDPGEFVQVTVSDTGVGMGSEDLARIFQPFFSTKAPNRGSGLGLTMVQGFATLSGGAVNVESEPGQGTTFRIYLPRTTLLPELDRPGSSDMITTPTENRRILVVEDDLHVRSTLESLLRQAGFDVATAAGLDDALDHVANGLRSELLLSDIRLAGKHNGFEVARFLKEKIPGLRSVFVSGYVGDEIEDLTMIPDGAIVVAKPFRKDALLDAIRRGLKDEPFRSHENCAD